MNVLTFCAVFSLFCPQAPRGDLEVSPMSLFVWQELPVLILSSNFPKWVSFSPFRGGKMVINKKAALV